MRKRSGDHLGDAKMSKKAPRSVEFNFLLIAIDTNGFHIIKDEGQIYKTHIFDFLNLVTVKEEILVRNLIS